VIVVTKVLRIVNPVFAPFPYVVDMPRGITMYYATNYFASPFQNSHVLCRCLCV